MAALDFPASPTLGQIYTANGLSWSWNGSSWSAQNVGGVKIATTAPSSPVLGDLWWESDTGILFTYTGSVWVEAEQPLDNPIIDLNGGTASTTTFGYLLDLGASA